MTRLLSTFISLTVIGCLLFGSVAAQQFAYYAYLIIATMAWIGLFGGGITADVVREEMRFLWLSIPTTALTIYALVITNHTFLAASSLVFALAFLGIAHNSKEGHS